MLSSQRYLWRFRNNLSAKRNPLSAVLILIRVRVEMSGGFEMVVTEGEDFHWRRHFTLSPGTLPASFLPPSPRARPPRKPPPIPAVSNLRCVQRIYVKLHVSDVFHYTRFLCLRHVKVYGNVINRPYQSHTQLGIFNYILIPPSSPNVQKLSYLMELV